MVSRKLPSRNSTFKGCALIRGSYRYCGPGTTLQERLALGDPPINGLDEASKTHDIAYCVTQPSE